MSTIRGLAAIGLFAAVFAAHAATGWMGAEAEKAYDKELDAKRKAGDQNNDDYYEIHKDRRIYVFTDFKDYQLWLTTDEIPLVVTRIGTGPNGETVKMQLSKKDSKAMEKTVGYKGPTQRMYEGELIGLEKGFYAEVHKQGRIYIFENGKDLHEFQKSGEVPCGLTQIGIGPGGQTVIFGQNCKAAAKGRPETAMARFKANYGLN